MLEGIRILLVDANDDERVMYQIVLDELGARVRVAASATDALEALAGELFDVLVSEVTLPGLSGYDLVREVRSLAPDRVGRVPAIAVAGFALPADKSAALDAGFDRYCSKPCGPRELAEAIAEVVRGRAEFDGDGA